MEQRTSPAPEAPSPAQPQPAQPTPAPTPPPAPTPVPASPPPPPQVKLVFTPEQEAKIKARLAERKATGPCPRCGQPEFALIGNGILKPPLQDLSEAVSLGGTTIPTVVTVCIRCGFLSLHALGTLGFLKGGKVDI